ncbi:MAG TPA: hypothetical protein VN658_10440 [Candidatus Acidoferrales bacterium]|nr:hypothetical protein [Candidatus Acidoferrales bacterium]
MYLSTDRLFKLMTAIWITISGWIVTLRARRRMKKSLGRKATDLELASLNTWMRVEETEQREEESRPIHPC